MSGSDNCGKVGGFCYRWEDIPVLENENSYDYYNPFSLFIEDPVEGKNNKDPKIVIKPYDYVPPKTPLMSDPDQPNQKEQRSLSRPALSDLNQIMKGNKINHPLFARFKGVVRGPNPVDGIYPLYLHRGRKSEILTNNHKCSEDDLKTSPEIFEIPKDIAEAFIYHFAYIYHQNAICQPSLDRKPGDEKMGYYNLQLDFNNTNKVIEELLDRSKTIDGLDMKWRIKIAKLLENAIERIEDEQSLISKNNIWLPLIGISIVASAFIAGWGIRVAYFNLDEAQANRKISEDIRDELKPKRKGDALDKFTHDMVKRAQNNELGPYDRTLHSNAMDDLRVALGANRSAALIGVHGIGKSALGEMLAMDVASGKIPSLIGASILELDLNAMEAGTGRRGSFEQNLQDFIDEILKKIKKGEKVVLVVEELHRLMGWGKADGIQGGAQVLKPYLARGELILVGSSTIKEFNEYIAKDNALKDRFELILLEEPSPKRTIACIEPRATKYEEDYRFQIPRETIEAVVRYADIYGNVNSLGYFPRKADRLLSLAGSWLKEFHPKEKVLTPELVRKFLESKLKQSLPPLEDLPPITIRFDIEEIIKTEAFEEELRVEFHESMHDEIKTIIEENARMLTDEIPRLWSEIPEQDKIDIYKAERGDSLPTARFIAEKTSDAIVRSNYMYQNSRRDREERDRERERRDARRIK